MIDRVEKKDCTGCGACSAVCPRKAVRLEEDQDGFLYPVIDRDMCVECGKCENTCPALQRPSLNAPLSVFAAAASRNSLLMRTASGGAFTALAEQHLERGGTVYGCAVKWGDFDGRKVSLRQVRVTDRKGLAALSGSKYAQSRSAESYARVRADLLEGRQVLFSGTPCQCAGLRRYLRAENTPEDNLYVVDILCHGVPAEKLFRLYAAYLEEKYGGEVTAYQFRDKTRGHTYYPRFRLKKDGKERWVLLSTMEEGYWYLFQNSLANRESCFSCPYAAPERCGDLTLGDYWGIEQAHPELLADGGGPLQREKGISLLLVNTEKGEQLLRQCGAGLRRFPSTLDLALVRGDALRKPSAMPEDRRAVLRILREKGYAGAAAWVRRTMGARYWKSVLKEKAKRMVKVRFPGKR